MGANRLRRTRPLTAEEMRVPLLRTAPLSPAELRAMFAEGDSVAQIYGCAYRLDRSVTKDHVRAILFEGVDA